MSHRLVKIIKTKYTFRMQHVIKVKLTIVSLKNPQFLNSETHDHKDG